MQLFSCSSCLIRFVQYSLLVTHSQLAYVILQHHPHTDDIIQYYRLSPQNKKPFFDDFSQDNDDTYSSFFHRKLKANTNKHKRKHKKKNNTPSPREFNDPKHIINEEQDLSEWSCVYDPEDTTDCDKMMAERLPLPTEYQIPGSKQSIGRRRWLLFGDSTMNLLYHGSSLDELLDPNNDNSVEKGSKYCPIKDIQRTTRTENTNEEVGKRPKLCALYDVMELEHRKEWALPDHSNLVGPRNYGFRNPFCKDCGSCKTEYHVCSRIENVKVLGTDLVSTDDVHCKSGRQVYGGYLSQDFAKDVELQTDAYLYTQENYAAFIASTWNTPELLVDWGKPICVIRNGMHDIAFLTNENDEDFDKKYKDNVGWMLEQYQPVCEHIVWLGNTANGN